MAGLPYYQRFPRDLLEACVGMTFEVRAGYGLILDLIYMKDGRLPDDRRWIAGHLGCSTRMVGNIINELISRKKLVLSDGFLTNNRADNIVETTAKYRFKQAENGSKSNKNKDKSEAKTKPQRQRPITTAKAVVPRKRCPAEWMPSEETIAKLKEEGVGEFNRPSALARFKDHEFPKARVDWDATYRNWIRKDAADAARNPTRLNGHDERKQAALDLLAEPGDDQREGQLRIVDAGRPDLPAIDAGSHYERQPSRR